MQHTVKRGLLFEKAKQSFVNRKKLVRFDLNPLLERSDVLHHDLKELKYRGFACEEYKQSEVSCESWNPNLPRQVRKFSTEDFWDYVFSDEWKDYSSLRVEEGQLLDKLLGQLFILEEKQNLRGFQMSQFDVIKTNRKGCLVEHETETKGKHNTSDIPIKLKLVFYEVINRFEEADFKYPERFQQKTPLAVIRARNRRNRKRSKSRGRRSGSVDSALGLGDTKGTVTPLSDILKPKLSQPSIGDTRVKYITLNPMTLGLKCGEVGAPTDLATDRRVRIATHAFTAATKAVKSDGDVDELKKAAAAKAAASKGDVVRVTSEDEILYRRQQLLEACRKELKPIDEERVIHKLAIAEAVGAISAMPMHRTAYERANEIPIAERVMKQVTYMTEYHTGEKPMLPYITETKLRIMEKINSSSPHDQVVHEMLEKADQKFELFDSSERIIPCGECPSKTTQEKVNYGERLRNKNPPLPPIKPSINQPMSDYSKLSRIEKPRLPLNLKIVENKQRYEKDGRVSELACVPHATPNLIEEEEFPEVPPLKTTTKSFKVHKQVSKRPRWRPPTWKIDMLNEIKKLTRKVQRKTEIIHMLEELLERRFLPRITNMMTRDFPTPYRPPGFKPKFKMSELELNLQPHYIDPEPPPNKFKKPGVIEFRAHVIKACEQFVVRKELATYNIGTYFHTMTSVTINRKPGLPPWGPYTTMLKPPGTDAQNDNGSSQPMTSTIPVITVKSASRSGRTTPNYAVDFAPSPPKNRNKRARPQSARHRPKWSASTRSSNLSTPRTSDVSRTSSRKTSQASTGSCRTSSIGSRVSSKNGGTSQESTTTKARRKPTKTTSTGDDVVEQGNATACSVLEQGKAPEPSTVGQGHIFRIRKKLHRN